jgi:hypothetical protein
VRLKLITFIAVLAVLAAGCDSSRSGTARPAEASAVDCAHPADLEPIPEGAVELPIGGIAVGYREWHSISQACDRAVTVGGGVPIVFGDQPVPWIAHTRVAPGLTSQARLRVVMSRLEEAGEVTFSDVDAGYVVRDPYGNLDPRSGWTPGTYRIRILAGTYVVADGTFVVAGGAPASIGP